MTREKMSLPEIQTEQKSGKEKFLLNGIEQDYSLIDFWSWNQSDLIENRTRGILAEYIVKKALEIKSNDRIEWDDYDIITETGVKIEIKSAAYIQTWEQTKYSNISFDISVNKRSNSERKSDFYLFCLLDCKTQNNINPLNLEQWTFFVVETIEINNVLQSQSTITLNSLKRKLKYVECKYSEIKKTIGNNVYSK
jgi:hypothetical protein